MISLLLNWLSSGVLRQVLQVLEKQMTHRAAHTVGRMDRAREEIRAELQARSEARKVLLAENGFFWSAGRLGRLVFVLPLGFWWAAVCLDSVFRFGWNVAEVPVLRDWGGVIVASLFLVDGARAISRGFVAGRKA
ncbi:conserved hypothetical protein [Roseibium sp. TrichSKD4]|uniref:hypothetical protein n=1 Tax=Roseibium sp. TrichSKD4 TaxID=744980 RepID=UPI0001E572B4|nr:hypothetical protein [Roseibium sp. TrichSKD4]EFO29092.1 conserved hypothetical protein [Roseibium sp. TrichSKD4]